MPSIKTVSGSLRGNPCIGHTRMTFISFYLRKFAICTIAVCLRCAGKQPTHQHTFELTEWHKAWQQDGKKMVEGAIMHA